MLRIVAATRYNRLAFESQALLGRSLPTLESRKGVHADVLYRNCGGLPEAFNAALSRAEDSDLVVFIHDDVWLDDWFLPERLMEALDRFDVVGVAGNRRRVPRQPSWAFIDTRPTWDTPQNLSGAVAHIEGSMVRVSYYGESPRPVRLLDGVFLATKVEKLRQARVRFDSRFRFHCYDLDFCRTCEQAGLALGTWPIAITHASGGQFGSLEWSEAYAEYLAKWQE
jgi:GT2 family glycosyltransferase